MKACPSGIRCISAAVPSVHPGDVQGNVESMIALATGPVAESDVTVFPELCVTGATAGDLFLQKRFLDDCDAWVAEFLDATRDMHSVFVFGAPLRVGGGLYKVSYVARAGKVLGVVPSGTLTEEQQRCFSIASRELIRTVRIGEEEVPFGVDLVFSSENERSFRFRVGEPKMDEEPALLVCLPKAEKAIADGGMPPVADAVAMSRSGRCAVVVANAGGGESSSDGVYAGDTAIVVDGEIRCEGERFGFSSAAVSSWVDFSALEYRRLRARRGATVPQEVEVVFSMPGADLDEDRMQVDAHPFVPQDPGRCDARCAEVFAIQSTALATRLRNTGIRHVVLGLSGGLDSTLALLVCVKAFQRVGLPHEGIHLYTMPGFGTGSRTHSNACLLAEGLGLGLEEVSIVESCRLHLQEIGHDGVTTDAAYENSQARERTQILMDKANQVGGLVVGTGDLSEIALGWCTFGGDQLSMYGVNAGVPKTLIQAVVMWCSEQAEFAPVGDVLRAVVETPVSPELLPTDEAGEMVQKTEEVVGPYELHDFFLYHFLRDGTDPETMRYLAQVAFRGVYSEEVIGHWLGVFTRRFFSQQFKRVASAEAPQVLSVSLDPREGWRMPGDVHATAWR